MPPSDRDATPPSENESHPSSESSEAVASSNTAEPSNAVEPPAEAGTAALEEEQPDSGRPSLTSSPPSDHHTPPTGMRLAALCVSALGIVYGDIGTSPLYALRECFSKEHGVPVTQGNVLGILSLIFWSLTITISVKYVAYVLRADNRGEGGVLALMALAHSKMTTSSHKRAVIMGLGLFGAALLYGDGMITPAISVLSAAEGLTVISPTFGHLVQPITIGLLVLLFVMQKHGTARVGAVFGPIMVIWFLTLSSLGVYHIVRNPGVLMALNPYYAVEFFLHQGKTAFFTLGAVLLVVTGGEALYADMGHFGTRPIRVTWFLAVGPALLLNYLGQGALLLSRPAAAEHPFFEMAPRWGLLPLVILSACATVIASQALISGAFSITRQATMLGILPRVHIRHTSASEIGQIYVPAVNWMLMIATILLVVSFGSSTKLAAAYGIAVTTTMLITTALAHVVARQMWGWSGWAAAAVTTVLFSIDLAFFASTSIKFAQGGWVPIAVAFGILVLMTTWQRGRALVAERVLEEVIPLDDFFEVMRIERPARVPGTAVFMTSNTDGTPTPLMHNFQHNRVVHQQVILLTVQTEQVSFVLPHERVTVEHLREGFVRVVARYGFMEVPDMKQLLARKDTPTPPIEHTTFFLGRESIRISHKRGMALWRKRLYAFMARNAARATSFFQLPSDRVVELGGQIDL